MAGSAPEVFGQYELVARIGQGGMGETWKARRRDVPNAPLVVIKRILPQHAEDPRFVESFVNEAHTTASLDHPNIARVLDFGQVAGEYFFAIELVHGRTIDGLIDAMEERGVRTLPVPVACFLALEMLEGLGYAHARRNSDGTALRIVHRDISPDNVLVGFDGTVKVVDFGVAKAHFANRRETQAGFVKGKTAYFSPEQARGEVLDGRSDLFAVGVTLYRMVCGRLPFEGRHFTGVHQMLKGNYPAPLALVPSLPPVLSTAIVRSMELRPDQRFQAAANMQTALRSVLAAVEPGFDRAQLRAFVHWAFEPQLRSEGITSESLPAQREGFEAWAAKERERGAHPVVAAPPAPLDATVNATIARPSSQQATPDSALLPPVMRRVLLWGFLLGAGFAVGIWATQPAGSSRSTVERRVRLGGAIDAFNNLKANHPHRAGALEGDYLAVIAAFSSDEADTDFALRCSKLRAEATRIARDAAADAPAALDAGVGPESVSSLQVERVFLDGPDEQFIDLSLKRHNLRRVPSSEGIISRADGYHMTVLAQPESSPWGGLIVAATVAAGKNVVLGTQKETFLRDVRFLRFFDFLPFRKDAPRIQGRLKVYPGADEGATATPFEIDSSTGGYVELDRVDTRDGLELRLLPGPATTEVVLVSSCDDTMKIGSPAQFWGPKRCAVAVVAPRDSKGEVRVRAFTARPLLPEPQLRDFGDLAYWPSKDAALEAAIENFRAFRYDLVEASLKDCRQEQCLLLLAVTQARMGQKARALQAYRRFLAEAPKDPHSAEVRRIVAAATTGSRQASPRTGAE